VPRAVARAIPTLSVGAKPLFVKLSSFVLVAKESMVLYFVLVPATQRPNGQVIADAHSHRVQGAQGLKSSCGISRNFGFATKPRDCRSLRLEVRIVCSGDLRLGLIRISAPRWLLPLRAPHLCWKKARITRPDRVQALVASPAVEPPRIRSAPAYPSWMWINWIQLASHQPVKCPLVNPGACYRNAEFSARLLSPAPE
jgi:hypothetical protein